MAQYYVPEPTIRPYPNFNLTEDGTALRAAMKGLGTDEQAIIDILTSRSNSQRQQIVKFFNEEYGRDIIEDLKNELGGKFEDLIVALCLPPVDYLCKQLHKAMKGAGTNEHSLIEILCSHSNEEIQNIVDAYERLYDRPLAEHLCSEISGDFRRLLTLIVTGVRNDPSVVNPEAARELAERLYSAGKLWEEISVHVFALAELAGCVVVVHEREPESVGPLLRQWQQVKDGKEPDRESANLAAQQLVDAGEAKLGTDEEVFNRILAHESFPQLRLVFEEYKHISGRTIEQAIKNELTGELKEAMLAIVECVQCPPTFFARRLHDAVAGAGTDDSTLIRIIVSRSEIDLGNIKREYERLFEKTLQSAIEGETHGDYKKALLAIVGEA